MNLPRVFLCLLCFLLLSCSSKGPYDTDPKEPKESLETIRLVDGFNVELMAAEPLVTDPVEITWDENGLLYVAEMLDYPFDPKPGARPRSRIRVLEDTDADGKPDKATIFADQLLNVTSVFPWKGGIFATAAPDILYLKDSDGDRKADIREVWYTGFDREVSSEARITNLRYGLDNWIWAGNSGRPGTIRSPKFPGKGEVRVRGYDFRFNPSTGDFAPAAGTTQFGMSFDDWGNRFVSQNTIHLRHVVLPAQYILRNPYLPPPSMLQYMSGHNPDASVIHPLTKPQQWRVERTQVRQERYNETQPGRVEEVGGHFTAATGATVYTGDAFPPDFRNSVFVADANGSLVHRDILTPEGATFRADPWPGDREFLASTDVWFRPVNFANAPDGTLWLIDFYREYIEEPASIPEAIKQRLKLDFYRGTDRGRLYRIVPAKGSVPRRSGTEAGKATREQLVDWLGAQNGWHRQTAQRLLVERKDIAAVPLLEVRLKDSDPLARLHALRTLEGLGKLTRAQAEAALRDPEPRVRVHALQAAEAFLPESGRAILALGTDPDPRVQFQLALTLGGMPGTEPLLAKIVARNPEDVWFRNAVLTCPPERALGLLRELVTAQRSFFAKTSRGKEEFIERLSMTAGALGDLEHIRGFVQLAATHPTLAATPWRVAVLKGIGSGLGPENRRGLPPGPTEPALVAMARSNDREVSAAASNLVQYFQLPDLVSGAMKVAGTPEQPIDQRVQAIRLLRGGASETVQPLLRTILTRAEPQEIHVAAIETLSVFSQPEAGPLLLAGWNGYGGPARSAAVDALLRQADRAALLLNEVEAARIQARAIDPLARIRLIQYPDAAIQERARKLLEQTTNTRAQVVRAHRDVLDMSADAGRGKAAFEEHCGRCHLRQGGRDRIGPDLSGVNNKSKEELLTHILDPSFKIEPAYANYVVVDKQGRIFDGLLAGETAAAITLRGGLEDVTILRENIREMRVAEVSMMPEGLEEQMSRQNIADVIAYLRAGL